MGKMEIQTIPMTRAILGFVIKTEIEQIKIKTQNYSLIPFMAYLKGIINKTLTHII